jgi:Tfp pilus assembly protein PilF
VSGVEAAFAQAWQQHQAGNLRQAEQLYQQILRQAPGHADAHHMLGVLAYQAGRLGEAEARYRECLRLRPDHADAQNNLGLLLVNQGKPGEAAAHLQQALRLRPDFPEAHNNLGIALLNQGKPAEAVGFFRQALRLQPDFPQAYNNLGNAFKEQRQFDQAEANYREALRLRPGFAEVHNNLGFLFVNQGKLGEAVASFREMARLQPGSPEAYNSLGNALQAQGQLEEAEASYREALRLRPDFVEAHFSRALGLLQSGDYARGWPEYEWRWRRPRTPPRPFQQPRWDGGPLGGRTILLYCEQGLGDAIQFVRYAPLVKDRGGAVVLECPGALIPLLSTCPGIDRPVARGQPLPDFDVQVPLLSLPGLLGTTLQTVPAQVPYLFAEEKRVERWRRVLGPPPGLKVGIIWQGNPQHPADYVRSIPLAQFAPLAGVEGVRLVSLQKGPGVEQLRELAGRFPVTELSEELDAEGGAFLDTAALMKSVDLVVTSDTAAAHLAGALGVPVWVALSRMADWRWLREREDSPWYPTMRLFRQSRLGDWAPVFEAMAGELRRLAQARRPSPAVWIEVSPGELLDRLSILEIRAGRLSDPGQLAPVRAELGALRRLRAEAVPRSDELARLEGQLRAVNERLWRVEDELRLCERAGDFGDRFVALARSVYQTNDERAALKRRVNELLGAASAEQKVYAAYEARQ